MEALYAANTPSIHRPLHNREVIELKSLIPFLDPIPLFDLFDSRTWTLDSARVFFLYFYFILFYFFGLNFFTSSPNRERFLLDKPIWKSKAPSKFKAFVWTTFLNRINTDDMLEKRKPLTTLSLNMCIMCGLDSKLGAHLFLHCPIARSLWNRFLVSLKNHGFAQWIYIIFSLLNSEVLAPIKM